jgi:hypothetical protein
MTDHTIIAATSAALRALFEGPIAFGAAPESNGLMIDLHSPRDLQVDPDVPGLSVWLFRVEAATDRRAVVPMLAGERLGAEGLALDLHYLLTPLGAGPEEEQTVLGQVLETLRQHPVLTGPDLRGGLTGEVRLSLETLTLEESTHLWAALETPFRLAVAVLARPLLRAA